MSLFNTITDGMANAGTYIQQNFEKLAKAIVSIDDTTGEIELGDVKVNNLAVSGDTAGWIVLEHASVFSGTIEYRRLNGVLYVRSRSGFSASGSIPTTPIATIPGGTGFSAEVYGIAIIGTAIGRVTYAVNGDISLNITNGTYTPNSYITLNDVVN